jgi:hypothetical protein
MLKKSKVIAAGLSLVLASIAGIADAGESSMTNQDIYNRNNCRAAYLDATPGFEGNFETIEYTIPAMVNGETVSVSGMTWNNVGADTGEFSCVNGTIYFSGADYETYEWSTPG